MARVVTYGYDASIAKFSRLWQGVDTSGLDAYGTDLATAVRNSRLQTDGECVIPELDVPIYFIGHSLGGLVIQQALLHCLESDNSLLQVASRTAGIIFMGTPTKGSGLASWASRLAKAFQFLVPFWENNINGEILKVLKTKSAVCEKVQSQFESEAKHGKLSNLKFFCFYETIAMSGTIVVPQKSAVIKSANSCSISAMHRDIVKFASKNDYGYTKVVGQFKIWTKGMTRADKQEVRSKAESDDPTSPDNQPGDSAKGRRGAPVAFGNTFQSISDIKGGNLTFGNTVVGGDHFDMRNMGTVKGKGKITGKVVYERSAAENEWSSSDQWSSSDDEPDGEDGAEKV